jgi:ABC-type branched-subunit amino acid transport system substrate-binding protein
MRRRRMATVVLGGALLAVTLTAYASARSPISSPKAASSAPINILMLADLSGPTKVSGQLEATAMRAAVDYYNAHGGVDGHRFHLTVTDYGGNAATAQSLAIKALSGGGASNYTMVVPGTEGGAIAALTPYIARTNVLAEVEDDGTGVCGKASSCPHEFSLWGSPSIASGADAIWFKKHGYKKVGILEEATAFTQSEVTALQSDLKRDGISYVTASYPFTATDVTPEMSQLQSAGVGAVYATAIVPAPGYVLDARAKLGWTVPIVFDGTASAVDLTTVVTSATDLSHTSITAPPCMLPSIPHKGMTVMDAYSPSLATTDFPCHNYGGAWDSIVLLADAVKQAKSLNYGALTNAMEHLSPAAQKDPLFTVFRGARFTVADHDNLAGQPSSFSIIPPGPIHGGQLKTG